MKKRIARDNSFLTAKEMDFENEDERDQNIEETQPTSDD